jgi:histidine triad (HIT) family protein
MADGRGWSRYGLYASPRGRYGALASDPLGATMSDCLFCKIVRREVPSDRVASAEGIIAFRDIAPRAPVHVLVVPEQHIPSVHHLDDGQGDLLTRCFALAREVAEREGIADGYRVTTNVGPGGGQAIPHLHFHVLGGRQLAHIDSGEPPGDGHGPG